MSRPTDFIRRMLQLRIFLMVNLVVLFFLSLSFGRQWLRNASIESQIRELTEQTQSMGSRNSELWSLGQTIQSQFYLEKEGRLKYGLSKPGEELVVVTDQQTVEPASTDAESIPSSSDDATEGLLADSNPKRWWNYFFNHAAYQTLNHSYGG